MRFLWIYFLFISIPALAQSVAKEDKSMDNTYIVENKPFVVIGKILISGNEKTHQRIILRELNLTEGDTVWLSKADSVLLRSKNNIFNTNLFVSVDLSLEKPINQEEVFLKVKLLERWYFFPLPIFELSDRNFNEWLNTYNADLSRTNYGIRLIQENFRGRKEKLDMIMQFGFTKKFSLVYDIPFLDKKQKHGLRFGVLYADNKSIPYQTNDHFLQFVEAPEVLRRKIEANITFTKRNAFYSFHEFGIYFKNTTVADTILALNPNYFLNPQNKQQYLSIFYKFRHDLRDIQAYPLKGTLFQWTIEKNGVGILGNDLNNLRSQLVYARYTDLGKKWFLENYLTGRMLLNPQPYANAQALGYGDDFLRGFELNVIDGQNFIISKNTLKYQLLNIKKYIRFAPIRQFRTIPLAMYLTTYLDGGYVSDRFFTETNKRLNNTLIYSGGIGLDLVTYYNLVLKFNYSLNSVGRAGFFFGFSTSL